VATDAEEGVCREVIAPERGVDDAEEEGEDEDEYEEEEGEEGIANAVSRMLNC
jgi:hypothetical protein